MALNEKTDSGRGDSVVSDFSDGGEVGRLCTWQQHAGAMQEEKSRVAFVQQLLAAVALSVAHATGVGPHAVTLAIAITASTAKMDCPRFTALT